MTGYSSLLTDYIGEGTAASRPATLDIAATALGLYYATDTFVLSLWNGASWVTALTTTAAANYQHSPADPTAPASTSVYAMQGLAGAITPGRTGTVLLIVSGSIASPSGTTAGLGIVYQLSYGTGGAPANAAALAGTQVGTAQEYTNPGTVTAADVSVPFSVQAVITGLTIGTAYWIDLAAKSVGTASDMGLAKISITAIEMS